MPRLSDKRIIVTGAASGIGRATAICVACYGARVAAFDIDDRGREAVRTIASAGGVARFWRVDVSDETSVSRSVDDACQWLGGLDVLLHIAGVIQGVMVDIADVSETVWDRVVEVNLKGSFLMAKHAAKRMKSAGHGVIVLPASQGGVTGGAASIPYAPSKGGVHGLMLVLAEKLATQGIRVNEVCPGKVDTGMIAIGREEVYQNTGRRPEPAPADGSGSPFLNEGNLSRPEGVAEIYAFLASDEADDIQGSIFTRQY